MSILDTGADKTIFHVQLASALGIKVENGIKYEMSGIASDVKTTGYIHQVKLLVAGESIDVRVVLTDKIPIGGILGQTGFFDHFTATFDWTPDPPCFEIQRIARN